jgi:hypothetical protein
LGKPTSPPAMTYPRNLLIALLLEKVPLASPTTNLSKEYSSAVMSSR